MPYIEILILVLSASLNVFMQIFSYKYLVKKRLLRSEYVGFICGFIILMICEFFAYGKSQQERLSLTCANIIIYLCFSYLYFHFINMGETARRIRLLTELYDAPEGLTKEQILSRYNAEDIVSVRIARLLNNNQIILHNGRYHVGSPVMLLISKLIILMKLIVLGKRSEFEK